jgi:hypothetical protein
MANMGIMYLDGKEMLSKGQWILLASEIVLPSRRKLMPMLISARSQNVSMIMSSMLRTIGVRVRNTSDMRKLLPL